MTWAYAAKAGWTPNSLYVFGGVTPGGSSAAYTTARTTLEYTQTDTWINRGEYAGSTSYSFLGSFTLDLGATGKRLFAVGGGFGTAGEGLSSETHRFNPNTHTWAIDSAAFAGAARSQMACFAMGGFGYQVGGHHFSTPYYYDLDDMEKYTEGTGTWAAVAGGSLATALSGARAAVVGSVAWLFGGKTNVAEFSDQLDGGSAVDTVQSTDGATWTTGYAALSNARHGVGASAVGTDIFVSGGKEGGWTDKIEKYDTLTDTWTQMLPDDNNDGLLPRRNWHASEVVLGKVLLAGGRIATNGNKETTNVRLYDPVSNTLVTKADMDHPARFGMASGVI
jgi:hypothetical protein